jgi:hypothetical protein
MLSSLLLLLLLALSTTPVTAAVSHMLLSAVSHMLLSIDAGGKISVEVSIDATTTPQQASPSIDLHLVPLPFRVVESAKIQAPEDVRISILGKGDGYTLLVAAIPSVREKSVLRLQDAFALAESPEAKALVEFDLSYPFLSQSDRQLVTTKYSLIPRRITIDLPREYEDTEVSFRPIELKRISKRQYILDTISAGTTALSKVWLVFPNPMQSQLQIAKILLGALLGLFTVLLHIPMLRQQKLWWSLTVLAVSGAVLCLILYYAYALSKRLDLIEWAAASAPHAFYGLLSSIFLLVAKRRQATITGRITLEGGPIQFADIRLWRIANGERHQVKRIEALETEGRYFFRIWPRHKGDKF